MYYVQSVPMAVTVSVEPYEAVEVHMPTPAGAEVVLLCNFCPSGGASGMEARFN